MDSTGLKLFNEVNLMLLVVMIRLKVFQTSVSVKKSSLAHLKDAVIPKQSSHSRNPHEKKLFVSLPSQATWAGAIG